VKYKIVTIVALMSGFTHQRLKNTTIISVVTNVNKSLNQNIYLVIAIGELVQETMKFVIPVKMNFTEPRLALMVKTFVALGVKLSILKNVKLVTPILTGVADTQNHMAQTGIRKEEKHSNEMDTSVKFVT
jgi:hypothetical protein